MSQGYKFWNRTQLDAAVDLWISDAPAAITTYGDINTWDVSAITDFSELFKDKSTFNSDISSWDVSAGRYFRQMFHNAISFNQDIRNWDVRSGTSFYAMFENSSVAHKFTFRYTIFNYFIFSKNT